MFLVHSSGWQSGSIIYSFTPGPVFLDVKCPLPLEIDVLIIVCELALDWIMPTRDETTRCILYRGGKDMGLCLRPVATHHEVWFVNCRTKQRVVSHKVRLELEQGVPPPLVHRLIGHTRWGLELWQGVPPLGSQAHRRVAQGVPPIFVHRLIGHTKWA